MQTLLISHRSCIDHDPGDLHPEHPDRLRGVLRRLEAADFTFLARMEAPRADHTQLLRVHPLSYIEEIMDKVPHEGRRRIDDDTLMSPMTGEAALRAAGGACAAVDAVCRKEARNAFVAARPPGHHAERDRAMGFCFFNTVAIAAHHARAVHGMEKIAVMDWDVHHGNGVQDIFWDDPHAFYASTHQDRLWPGTGQAHETGAHGNILNHPLPSGSGSEAFGEAMSGKILPALRGFNPDILFVSAGFDAHERDPLANLRLRVADFVRATEDVKAVAQDCCDGRLVSVMEGGYDIEALAASVAAHVRSLMGA